MKDLDIGIIDCSDKDFSDAARSIEDLADIIEEVGIDTLKKELGINIPSLNSLF